MTELRKGLPPLPARIAQLPVDDRGYPVPWFVTWINGKPDFRVVEARKVFLGHTEHRCWICGQQLGRTFAFVAGPMCAVNRNSAEPPSHTECALFAVKACPFILLPKAQRREANLPVETTDPAGHMIKRNPGVAMVWITRAYRIHVEPRGLLFELGEPETVHWYAQGQPATREQVLESIESGIPLLEEVCDGDEKELALLAGAVNNVLRHLPPVEVKV